MKVILRFLKPVVPEIAILIIFLFVAYAYIGPVKQTLKSDAIGYYDYLPSIFIQHDFVRKDNPLSKDPILYKRIDSLEFYRVTGDFKVNKYACGTAVLQLPFFACSYLFTRNEGNFNDGYQWPYQRAVFYATIFYLFLGIFFLKKILQLYDIKRNIIIITQILLVFATPVTNYANYDAGFSHIYSLFAVTAFLYFVKSYFKNSDKSHLILACVFYGLIIILRQINFIIILIVPFLAGSWTSLKNGFVLLFRDPKLLITGIFIIAGIAFVQSLAWYFQTGKFFVYSYVGESFDFSHPQILNILFSYKKGLFVYTPVLFISLFSLVWLGFKRQYYLVITWLFFFSLLTYVLSSWYSWDYGASFGLRAYVDFLGIFFIIFALMLEEMKRVMKGAVIVLSFLAILLNLVQTYQYKVFILHWISMDKELYWKVFLKTSKNFKGLAWKKQIDLSSYECAEEYLLGDTSISKNAESVIYSRSLTDIPGFGEIKVVQVSIDNEFNDKNDSRIILSINDLIRDTCYYIEKPYLIWFPDHQLNEWQTGLYNFEIQQIVDLQNKRLNLQVNSGHQNIELKNVRIRYLKSR